MAQQGGDIDHGRDASARGLSRLPDLGNALPRLGQPIGKPLHIADELGEVGSKFKLEGLGHGVSLCSNALPQRDAARIASASRLRRAFAISVNSSSCRHVARSRSARLWP